MVQIRSVVVPVALAALALGVATELRSGPDDAAPARTSTSSSSVTSTTISLLDACTGNLVYWVPKVVAGDPAARYGDYQTMGLTGAEYEALRALLDEVRAGGATGSPAVLAARARAHCASRPLRSGWS